jgi:hypothetical protein
MTVCCFEQPKPPLLLECPARLGNVIFSLLREAKAMNIHPSLAPSLWGAAGGAAAIAIIGFTWGGWVTVGNAQRSADQQEPDSALQLAALKKINLYFR